MEDLLRSVSSAISDRFYSFFSLTAAVASEPTECDGNVDAYEETEECDGSQDSDTENDVVEELQTRLLGFYGNATATAVWQAQMVLRAHFAGDVGCFLARFLTPGLALLERLRRQVCEHASNIVAERGSSVSPDNYWPLAVNDAVLVHLCARTLSSQLHVEGDFIFSLRLSPDEAEDQSLPSLVLSVCSPDGVTEFPVDESDFGRAFISMDWLTHAQQVPDGDLKHVLRQCLVATRDVVQRLQWEETLARGPDFGGVDGVMTCSGSDSFCSVEDSGVNDRNRSSDEETRDGDGYKDVKSDENDDDKTVNSAEGCLVGDRDVAGLDTDTEQRKGSVSNVELSAEDPALARCLQEQRNSSYYTQRIVTSPDTIAQLDSQLVHSGVAILPGSIDVTGKRVIFIFTCSTLWHNRQIVSTELARLLMYYHSIPRKEIVSQGITIVVDIHGATSSTVNILLESLYLFKDNVPNKVAVIHMITDKPTQSLVLKSPVYDPHSGVCLNFLLSQELLLKIISLDQLPSALDGTFPYSHEEWVRFRVKLEPFLRNCRAVAQFLVEVMQELASSDVLPCSTHKTRQIIERHEASVKSAFNDSRLLAIENDGEAIMSSLRRDESSCCHSEDYRDALEKVTSLYQELQDTMTQLACLADKRLNRLEQCLQLRGFEEECEKVLCWLREDGQVMLTRHTVTADNLKSVRSQQKDFEKLYFAAMTYVEKGNDLIEEAAMLAQSEAFSESALGYRDTARLLKKQLQLFSSQLEDTHERIEGTARCYSLLDKSYEWALEAMKYVASMKMEHCASGSGLNKLLTSLEQYLKQHPPMCDDVFCRMIDTAQQLRNDKLLEQCRVAKARCQETYHLLLLRRNTLRRAKDHLASELTSGGCGVASEASDQDQGLDLADGFLLPHESGVQAEACGTVENGKACREEQKNEDDSHPVWEPRKTSTPSRVDSELWSDPYGNNYSRPSHYRGSSSVGSSLNGHVHMQDNDAAVLHGSAASKPGADLLDRPYHLPEKPRKCKELEEAADLKLSAPFGTAKLVLGRTISSPLPATSPAVVSSIPSVSLSCIHRPVKKILKRASTAPSPIVTASVIHEDQETDAHGKQQKDQHCGKTLSLMTGSSESLPSMPEEDEDYQDSQQTDSSGKGKKSSWTPVPVNTHLHQPSRTIPTGPMADLRLSEAEMKSRRTVLLIMSEMVQTERDYVHSLQYVIENYIPELHRQDVPQVLRGKRNVIFGNIEKIYQFHSQFFLRELECCELNPYLVGHYFLRHENDFHLYTLYNKNKPKSDDLMMELGKHFFRQKQLELNDRMDLASYLLKPVQRMGKYALLLKQILKECPDAEAEHADLKAAEEMVRFQLRHGNDLLAMDSLRECDVNLQEQGRLLRQEEFLVFQGRRKMMRRVFLFEDLILFSKTRRGRQGQHDIYVYKHSFKMADIGLTENCGDSGYKFEIWFRRRTLGENYILQALNSESKRVWVQDISKLLWRQALKNRESHINEMASMGIGNKPCLDLKPSCDNIQDRSLNISLSNRGARTRNSIAVSSFEYLRNGTKRPHSIISVSSNSSSNSSHSSLGLFGSLNLAFDPVDVPHIQRQSLLSNESGIEADNSSGDGDPGGGKSDHEQKMNSSPEEPCADVTRSRNFNQRFAEPIMTDV